MFLAFFILYSTLVMSSSVLLFGPPYAVAGPSGNIFESSNYDSSGKESIPSELVAKSQINV